MGQNDMTTAKEFEEFAGECKRFANGTRDERTREQLIQMARQWMQLAMDEEDRQAIISLPSSSISPPGS